MVALALDHIEAQAQFDGPERAIHLRVAEHTIISILPMPSGVRSIYPLWN
jgi:hypothetical protein